MFTIAKQFQFSASHSLNNVPGNHPCHKLHGHNYIIEIVLRSAHLNDYGFVVDYNELKTFKKFIDDRFDHQHLNDVLSFDPTAENIAKYLYDKTKKMWPQTIAIKVSETPNTWAEFRESL